MVKRQAEKQITDRDCDESDTEETPLNGAMQTASPQAISKRQIRALPRGGRTSTATAAPKLGVQPSNPKTSWSPFGHASQPSQPTTTLFGGSSSFDSKKISLFGSSPNPTSNPENQKSKSTNVQILTKYYASLRGLNMSVLKAFQDLTEKDAFMDLSKSFDHVKTKYNEYRTQIQSDLDKAMSSNTQKDQVHSSFSKDPSTTTTPFSLPTNGADKPSQENSISAKSSPFQTQTQTRPSDNDKGSPHDSKTGFTRNPFAMAAPARPSPLRYENEKVPEGNPAQESPVNSNVTTIPDGKPAVSLFSTWATVDSKSKPEEKSTDTSTASPSVSTNPENKSAPVSVFGTPSTTSTNSTSVFSAIAPKPFSFGSSQTQSSANKSPGIGFGFGVSGTATSSVFGGFGATKSNSIQATPPKNGFNPVGFSFGNSPPTSSSAFIGKIPDPVSTEKETVPNKSTSTPDNNVDATGSHVTIKAENSDPPETTEPSSAIPASNKGEEEEETLYETSGRVYALMNKKQEDGSMAKGWVGWAVCNVKLNRHKETKKSRILARSQVNQGILINFFVRSDLKPENRGSSLEIIGFNPEGTQLQAYRIRPSSEKIVQEFINAINLVVPSSSS